MSANNKAAPALPLTALIHRVADKASSRKSLFTLSDAYSLGPVLKGGFAIDCRFRPDILLHGWIDIHPTSLTI
jgi:hypothetical protein